jgi:hypothetical protein
MKKKFINKKVSIENFSNQRQVKIIIDQDSNSQLFMSLSLLNEGLSDQIEIKFLNFIIIFEISSNNECYYDSPLFKKGILKGKISRNEMEYILNYLLKYFRDGYGQAEHIDVDFMDAKDSECTLTFYCDDFKLYSEEEMRKMLS